ncbi:MAG: M28 family peptidase, partial [Bacteroidota bacterium]
MKRFFYLALALLWGPFSPAQTNIICTNSTAEAVMKGDYERADYLPTTIITSPDEIVDHLMTNITADSLKAYIIKLASFGNRNTGADTLSATKGLGASRRWVHQKFTEFSAAAENRLLPGYLQFDQDICGMGQHRNTIAVLPGTAADERDIIIIEGHIDSRCSGACDIDCLAEGVEDNASGTALVIELARVMSQLSFEHTIVFMATTGEEQGLFGANAFATYASSQNIWIKGVLNNDVIGGIICGATSSEPSCPGENLIDSTQVRLFSLGGNGSKHKSWCRFIKLEYQEEVLPNAAVPMMITLMSAEDRTGRGGDHIPFHDRNYTAMRFTAAHEHGDASNGPDYHDRQHTQEDILGIDTDNDGVIDSFFVDFNYLRRNALINANAAAMAAIGPIAPFNVLLSTTDTEGEIRVEVVDNNDYNHYRIGFRTDQMDFDSVYTLVGGKVDTITSTQRFNWITAASVDDNGVESLFSAERQAVLEFTNTSTSEPASAERKRYELMPNRPNPFDESTIIGWMVYDPPSVNRGEVRITDLNGRLVESLAVDLKLGLNEVLYR